MTELSGQSAFSPRVVIGMVVSGVLAFSAFLLLAAYGDQFKTGRDPRAHALSIGATGFQGLVRLIEYGGGEPRMVRDWDAYDQEDLLVITLEEQSDPELLANILSRRAARATLLILPKWQTVPDPLRSAWVRTVGTADPTHLASLLYDVADVKISQKKVRAGTARGSEYLQGFEAKLPSIVQSVSGEKVTPLLQSAEAGIILGRLQDRQLYILSDPDLMNNHALRDPSSALAALSLLQELSPTGSEAIYFDLMLTGYGQENSSLKLLFEPPFLALTLTIFAAAILAGLHGAVRFGAPRPENRSIGFGKAALIENSAGLMQLARREHKAGAAYADLVREAVAREIGAPKGLSGEALEAYLDRLSPAQGPPFNELVARISEAGNRDQLLKAAQAIYQWRKEVTS